MMEGKKTEPMFNMSLGEALRQTCARWKSACGSEEMIKIEETGVLRSSEGKHVDILIDDGAMPLLAIETSKEASDAETDAKNRLGEKTKSTTRPISTAIAVHMPDAYLSLGFEESKKRLVAESDLRYVLYQKEDDTSPPRRWPSTGWITGNVKGVV